MDAPILTLPMEYLKIDIILILCMMKIGWIYQIFQIIVIGVGLNDC